MSTHDDKEKLKQWRGWTGPLGSFARLVLDLLQSQRRTFGRLERAEGRLEDLECTKAYSKNCVPIGGCFGCKHCGDRFQTHFCDLGENAHGPAGLNVAEWVSNYGKHEHDDSLPLHPEWCPLK